MSTSLAQQLKKLAVPETSSLREDKKKASLLFDPKVAASLDRETFFEIGLSGFAELKSINSSFSIYENSLFNISSKDFERSIQTKDANNRLDKTIRSFLMKLSPYFLLQPAHKALEWLINRFQIHKYNMEDIFILILPYHETKIFVRFLQIIRLDDSWNWLEPLQKPGIPLTKPILFKKCVSDVSVLKFICDMTMKTVEEFGDSAEVLTTLFAFYYSTIVGALEYADVVHEPFISVILPGLLECLSSPIADLKAVGYLIVGQLVTKTQLKKKLTNHLINKTIVYGADMHYETALLLHLIYDTQNEATHITKKVFANITPHYMKMLCSNINILISKGVDPSKFLLAFFNGILPIIQKDTENFKIYSILPEIIIDEIQFSDSTAEKIIKCAIDCYSLNSTDVQNDTDIEILDDSFDDKQSSNIQQWYSTMMKNIEIKYPSQFDKVVKLEMKSNELAEEKIKALNEILGFAPKVMQKLGDTYLFEKLYHYNPDMRIEAVNFLISNFKKLYKADENFLKESINDRLTDDDPKVVCMMLNLEIKQFNQIFTEEVFVKHLLNIVNKSHMQEKWLTAAHLALNIICSLEFSFDQLGCLCILPFMFPSKKRDNELAIKLIKSSLGKSILSLDSEKLLDNKQALYEAVFDSLKSSTWLPHSSVTAKILSDMSQSEYVLGMFTLLLISFDLKKSRASFENYDVLEKVTGYMKKVDLTEINDQKLYAKSLHIFIKTAKRSKFPIKCFIHFCEELISNTDCKMPAKPWIDFKNESLDVGFVLRIYETLLDDYFQKFINSISSLLKLLLEKFYSSEQEKIEFLANIAMQYIILNPEKKSLKIRTIKILQVLFQNAKCLSWTLDSDVVISLLLVGMNSNDHHTRNLILQIIETLLNGTNDLKNHSSFILFQELYGRKEEIELDNNQLPLIIGTLLSPTSKQSDKTVRKSMKDNLRKIIGIICDTSVPYYIKCNLIVILSQIDSENAIIQYSKVALDILDNIKDGSCTDAYQSHLLSHIISYMNRLSSNKCFEDPSIWQFLEKTLSTKDSICYENNDCHYISVLMLQQIDETIFKLLNINQAQIVIRVILNSATFDSNPSIISAMSKMMKKIDLSSEHFMSIFKEMESVTGENITDKKKRSSAPSISILNTKEWRLGITLLEHIQSKKKLSGFEEMLPSLFHILKKCLDFEDQSIVEYSKQLLLTSILNCCQKIDFTKKKSYLKDINIELVILCIRGTQNPQTHHHALMLLAQIANIYPGQVLQYMMAIFTFIGSSVVRQDDAYSFQIITKIIETIIPIIVKFDLQNLNEKELLEIEHRTIPVLRIFVDAVLDIPEHRRLPLFTKLLETLSADNFIWIFLAILFESHIIHGVEESTTDRKEKLLNKEEPVKRLDFAMSLLLKFSPETIMTNFIKLILYLKSLPEDKPEGENISDNKPEVIFSISQHNSKHLRHFKYTIVTFVNNVLSSPIFIQNVSSQADQNVMEDLYKTFIVHTLTYIQVVSKIADKNVGKPQAKYWKVMLHHCYEVLDNTNNLLSVEMFLLVVRGLMLHNLSTVRRKAMEILNTKLHHNPKFFDECDKDVLFSILSPIMTIIEEIGKDEMPEGFSKQELELNQQTALLSLKLLVRLLSPSDPDKFKLILNTITDLVKCDLISGNLMASVVLCLSELCSNLKANALSNLPKFMPHLIKILKLHTESDASELVLLSVITAVYKIVETIPLFLSPYLEKLLYHLSILSAKWNNKTNTKTSLCTKLTAIKVKISSTIQPRVLIPIISKCYDLLLKKNHFDAIGPAMNILADSFADVTGPEFMTLQHDLTTFFLSALQFRSDHADDDNISNEEIDRIEEHIIKALVALVLKLSESSFRPLYFKIYDWSVRDPTENNKERAITFYRLSSYIADGLRGLFILFAGHFVKNSVDLLDSCNKNKTEDLYFPSEEKCCLLIEYIMKTLTSVFLHDTQNFVNKDKFETIMQPLVDQLDNHIGGLESLSTRAKNLIIPCISQFAIATADDSLWKPLNYQILLKTRHNDAAIRLLGLECMREMALKLGDSWLPLLPESVPFLAELLEDEIPEVETATQKSVQTLETVLGEPLQKYF